MPEPTTDPPAPAQAQTPTPPVECPPPAACPERCETDPRARLNELAADLARRPDRRRMAEYLRLRRTAP